MLQIPGATSYMGFIGKEKYGETIKKDAIAAGEAIKKDATAAGVNVKKFEQAQSCQLRLHMFYIRSRDTRFKQGEFFRRRHALDREGNGSSRFTRIKNSEMK